MADRNIDVHEYIDIVGEGAMDYMAHTIRRGETDASGGTLRLAGTWYVMGTTGRWPQVVNVWECVDGWIGWRDLMIKTNLNRTRNDQLNDWWRTALRTRTGGFDRVLAGAPGCPSVAELRDRGTRASLFVHELSRCRPGAALDYLAAVREEWSPVVADYGHSVFGLYEVLLTDVEVMTIWATDPQSHIELMAATVEGTDKRIERWRSRAREFLTEWREELMTPHPENFFSAGDPL